MEERAGAVPASQIISKSKRLLPQHQFTGEIRMSLLTDVRRPAGVDVWPLTYSFLRKTIQHVQNLAAKH